jgi:putative tryptophan/tyrosine transport system substrate-binding protein
LTSGTPAALAAKTATNTIPIVMGSIDDAVTPASCRASRPGGNITGFSALNPELEGKRLELLKLLIPELSRVGMLANAANPLLDVSLKSLRSAADVLGVSLDIFEIRTDEIDGALLKLVQARPEAVVVAADTLLRNSRREIVEALAKDNLPGIYRSGNIPLSVAFSCTARS